MFYCSYALSWGTLSGGALSWPSMLAKSSRPLGAVDGAEAADEIDVADAVTLNTCRVLLSPLAALSCGVYMLAAAVPTGTGKVARALRTERADTAGDAPTADDEPVREVGPNAANAAADKRGGTLSDKNGKGKGEKKK